MIDYANASEPLHRLPMQTTPAPATALTSVRTLATRLGMRSFKTLLKRVRVGEVPGVRLGSDTADGWFVDVAVAMAAATAPAPAPETPIAHRPGVSSARQPRRATNRGRVSGSVMSTRDMANAAARNKVESKR